MSQSLANYLVVVSGAAGLLGRMHCEALLARGAHVVAIDVDEPALSRIPRVVGAGLLTAVPCDITQEPEVREALEPLLASHAGRISLVNNAAVNPKAEGDRDSFFRLEDLPLSQWHEEIEVGLTGALILTRVVGFEMASRGEGTIVNVSSDHGLIAPDQRLYGGPESKRVKPVGYSVVKHGIIGLTRYTATYWAHRGVRANALCPGGVYDGQDAEFLADFSRIVPLGRMARPDEYQSALHFLVSDESSYMTGATLVIDGGRSVW